MIIFGVKLNLFIDFVPRLMELILHLGLYFRVRLGYAGWLKSDERSEEAMLVLERK